MNEEAMLDLLTRGRRELRRAFAEVIAYLREENQLHALENLIQRGHVDDAIQHLDRAAAKITERIERVYADAALASSRALAAQGVLSSFQVGHPLAVAQVNQLRLDRIQGFTEDQRAMTRQVLGRGLERGQNPRQMARELRASIGLTAHQEGLVENYRRQLEAGQYAAARSRQLHDGRFDQTMRAARARDLELTDEQITRMVDRYRSNWIAFRAETIARTEALTAVHLGSDQMYLQAIERREVNAQQLVCTWHAGSAPRTRDWHATMRNQERPWRVPFTSGQGNLLMFPGDPDATASERANCRCTRSVRIIKPKTQRLHAQEDR